MPAIHKILLVLLIFIFTYLSLIDAGKQLNPKDPSHRKQANEEGKTITWLLCFRESFTMKLFDCLILVCFILLYNG